MDKEKRYVVQAFSKPQGKFINVCIVWDHDKAIAEEKAYQDKVEELAGFVPKTKIIIDQVVSKHTIDIKKSDMPYTKRI